MSPTDHLAAAAVLIDAAQTRLADGRHEAGREQILALGHAVHDLQASLDHIEQALNRLKKAHYGPPREVPA